jgi:IS5 family transposase
LVALIGRYVHAKQFKRMKKAMRRLRTRVGRVHCEVQRQLHTLPEAAKAKVQDLLSCTHPDPADERQDKLYALHAPEVECIGKGKPGHPMSSE